MQYRNSLLTMNASITIVKKCRGALLVLAILFSAVQGYAQKVTGWELEKNAGKPGD